MLAEFLLSVAGRVAANLPDRMLTSAVDKRALRSDILTAVKRAEAHFAQEYSREDLELVEVLTAQIDLAEDPGLKKVISDLLMRPFHDPTESTDSIRRSFLDVLPSFSERGRVDSAVNHFLKCLGREVLYIPQLAPVYSLFLQKKSLDDSESIRINTSEIVENIKGLRRDLFELPQGPRDRPLELSDGYVQEEADPLPKHNLPQRPYVDFVDRRKDLNDLVELMGRRNRHFLVTLDGVGGVGKSALALELGYYYLEQHLTLPTDERFDAIVWVSAKQFLLTASGFQQRNQTFGGLGDLYREIATVFELPEILRADRGQQAGLIRSALTSRRVLIIVDNLETIDDIELLAFLLELPDPTKAVVTTRHRIDGAKPIRLEGMLSEDAIDLINQEAKDKNVSLTENLAEALFERTGGVPLGIVWSIGLMVLGYEPNSILDKLESGKSDIARFCFSESVSRIRERDAYTLLLALSLFETNVNRTMLGSVAGIKDDIRRDDGLAELIQISFVNKEGDRYSLLPLTRVFAFDELRIQSESESKLRENWITVLLEFARPYAEVNWRWHDLRRLSAEGKHLITLMSWAKQVDRPDLMLLVIPAVGFYYDFTGEWSERLAVEQLGVETARLLGNKKIQFIALRDISGVLGQQGHYEQAERSIASALKLAQEESQVAWQCKALVSLCALKRRQGLFNEAVNYSQQAIDLIADLPEQRRGEVWASIQYELGKVARDREDWNVAEKHFIAARDVFGFPPDSTEFDVGRAWGVLANLGVVSHKLGDLDTAEKIYLQCLDFCRKTGSKGSVATLLVRLAEVDEERGDYEVALKSAQEALAWSTQLGLIHERTIANGIVERLRERASLDQLPQDEN